MTTTALRFGTCLAPSIRPVYEHVADRVGRALGLSTTLEDCDDYGRFDAGEHDVAFVCSLPYLMASRRGDSPWGVVAAPVLEGERYGGRPVYFSDVIVRRDAPFGSFGDLRGASWAYNEPLSHSGYGVVRYHLLRMGETAGFFGRVVEAGFHQTAVEMVAAGDVDASAIDSQVLEVALRDRPELRDRLRVIESLGPSTIQPVTVSRRLPASLRREIAEVVVAMGDDPEAREALAVGLVRRFVPADDASYAGVRGMLEACEAAGFMTLR